ncbi:glycosyltransferase family 2 protein [Salegentibacter salegens]|uniref:Glycosyltransferase involved in cell wall bisynthesis n=1 Tax=Salegentibacter salegens TaxID=143223 RepID=A0A1M7NER9_9FLAO|nr:glycosyltransferase [Salegentibacter salegens]PRX41540.1 glycosyltransferase involved in cell wall biosynthesis [Salegentibacter salegens]SHN01862.1 Glycosyltransferase involved in cell wall bisynthesis [Salegentibacter salegens]
MKFLVSICIPTYNGVPFLQEALDSINQQTYRNIEVIISDDASNDQTLEIVQDFKAKAIFPVYIYHHKPKGIGANWNNCIKKANGKYIKFLFQDDVLLPNCIEEQIKVFKNYKNIGLVSSKREFIIEKNVSTEILQWADLFKDLQVNLKFQDNIISFLKNDFLKSEEFQRYPYNKIGEPSVVLFPKSIVEKIGYFREDMVQILDYEFYYRILRFKKIAIINKPLVKFRLHKQQTTNLNRNKLIHDDKLFDKVLYDKFFFYLNKKEKKRLLKLFRPRLYKILKKINFY